MYEVEFTPASIQDLRYFKKFEQNLILDAIQTQLPYEPVTETRNRFRRDPPDIAEWELRIGMFRVFYNVDEFVKLVRIERIGEKPNKALLKSSMNRNEVSVIQHLFHTQNQQRPKQYGILSWAGGLMVYGLDIPCFSRSPRALFHS